MVNFPSWEAGGWYDPVILKLNYFENIFEVICTLNFVCKLESSFSNIFSKKNPWKSHVFTIFYVKINFCLYFTHKMTISQFSRACLHYDVMVTSYISDWYLFWYQLKEDVHTYTLVVDVGYMTFSIGNPEEGCNNPTSENMFRKSPQENKS